MAGLIRKTLVRGGGALVLLVAALAAPVVWSETMCRAETSPQAAAQFVTSPEGQRPEARTAFVVPEWEIVYAYEDFARILETGAPHEFDYFNSITRFWSTLCAVRTEADRMGDPGTDAKTTIYTIGVSFTLEMVMKAAYEETLGRAITMIQGHDTPQDAVEAEMAANYGEFLHQTPWYRFSFDDWTNTLWDAPIASSLRGWERRLALWGEWETKAAYARVIQSAVDTMTPDKLTMEVHVTDLRDQDISTLPHARLISADESGHLMEVDRYRLFTETSKQIAQLGGRFTEIAGNDDILVSLLSRDIPRLPDTVRILQRSVRQGDVPDRFLIAVKVQDLTMLINDLGEADLEHIYDY